MPRCTLAPGVLGRVRRARSGGRVGARPLPGTETLGQFLIWRVRISLVGRLLCATAVGKRMADMLLDGRTLEFYQWDQGDVDKELLPGLRGKIDALVATWTREQKDLCLNETAASFKGGGSMLQHIRGPPAGA